MAINLQNLHDLMRQKVGGGGQVFTQQFLDAVNRVSIDLLSDVGLEVDEAASLEPLDLASKYYPAYRWGVAYYMNEDHQYGKEQPASLESKYRQAIGQAQAFYDFQNNLPAGNIAGTWGS